MFSIVILVKYNHYIILHTAITDHLLYDIYNEFYCIHPLPWITLVKQEMFP